MDELKAKIEKALEAFWDEVALEVAEIPEGVDGYVDVIDSNSAADALLIIEKIVDMEIDENRVIRRGGYDSQKQFVEHLTEQVLLYVAEKRK